jgi:diguanylate cyclase (GGDEF)-like protein/PAS domain S-box-containing protein
VDDSTRRDTERRALGQGVGAAEAMLDLLPEHVNRFRLSDHVITYCNAAWAQLYGTTPERAVGTSLDFYLSPSELEGLRLQLARLGPDRPMLVDVAPRRRPGEVERWIEWADRYLHCDREPEVLSIGRDVTSRYLAEQRLVESEARYRDLADKSSDIVWRISREPEVRFDYLSPSVERILGYPPAELIDDFELIGRITDGQVIELVGAALRGDPIPGRIDIRFRHADGSTVIGETSIRPVHEGMQGVTRDVTELRRLQAATAELAVRDPLTGLGNRRCFHTMLDAELERTAPSGDPVAIAFLDLDGLKRVNDRHGHRAGDLVLQATAQRLRDLVADVDRVARLGGDEFAIVYDPKSPEFADLVARLDAALSEPVVLSSDVTIDCSASIGQSDTCSVGREPVDLLAAADEAMYAAKRRRRGSVRRPT